VFKQATDGRATRIGVAEITKVLAPRTAPLHSGPASNAAGRLLASLGEWVNAAHQDRHDPGQPDPAPPPLDVAITMMATGAGFLRWLSTIDEQLKSAPG